MPPQLPLRRAWEPPLPDAVIHTEVGTRDAHPQYAGAKSGDADDAIVLAIELISDKAVSDLRSLIGARTPLLLPVVADETTGFNAIPDAMAQVMGREIRCEVVTGEIVQTNTVGHTRAKAFQRFVTPALFEGHVVPDANYVLVDDHVGLGGTIANLRGYVEANGGHVIAVTALTESRGARQISLGPETLAMLKEKYGQEIDTFWKRQFGYGIDCLTEVEAGILCRQPSLVTIENFLAQAAIEARGRGLEPAVG